ncbi:MAG TPA: DUF3365 domain-containing protein [Ghiorsea sp.]|nr:DUF3365 domain-containing protein [Ghiorsea sp.]HIP06735.1 DUF3365 domain-containing protein [Mariprofundaceae bacterium]
MMVSLTLSQQAIAADEQALKTEALSIVKQFGGALKPQLVHAMKQGGPVHAIDVCATQAPKIAQKLSTKTGWEVKRVSLKTRNANAATPDDWEKEVLKSFDQQQADGKKVGKMMTYSLKGNTFRFMKAQGVQPICLTCHGSNIKPNVRKALNKHFPNDLATGYNLGQVRGAISLTKFLNQ